MDILGFINGVVNFIGTPVGASIATVTTMLIGKRIVFYVYDKVSVPVKTFLVSALIGILKSLGHDDADLQFKKAVLVWIDAKYPELAGKDKLAKASLIIQKYGKEDPATADELVQRLFNDVADVIHRVGEAFSDTTVSQEGATA